MIITSVRLSGSCHEYQKTIKNMNKKITITLLGLITLFFTACEGSDTYRGKWKATDDSGAKSELVFEAETLTFIDSLDIKVTYKYTQNSVNISNSVETYGIKLNDGRSYQIHFPIADDESVGFINDESGNRLYTISRTKFMTNQDVYKLN